METKKPWESKTLWFNLIMGVLAVAWPVANAYLAAHPDVVAVGFTIINVILRLVTKEQLSLKDNVPTIEMKN